MQKRMANWCESLISTVIGADVKIGNIYFNMLNRIVIDDITINDNKGEIISNISRLATTFELSSLYEGRLNISSIQIFGIELNLYRHTLQSELNCQFILDALKSNENEKTSAIDLRINSFILRNGKIKYDILSEELTKGVFNSSHIYLTDLNSTISLKEFSSDSLNLNIKRLNAYEANSGFYLSNLKTKIEANNESAKILQTGISLNYSDINLDTLYLNYSNYDIDSSFVYSTKICNTNFYISDVSPFIQTLKDISTPLNLYANVYGTNKHININDISIATQDRGFCFESDLYYSFEEFINKLQINKLEVSSETYDILKESKLISKDLFEYLNRINKLNFVGNVNRIDSIITLDGLLNSTLGIADIKLEYINNDSISTYINTKDINLSKLLNNKDLGNISFAFESNLKFNDESITGGIVKTTINNFDYLSYNYRDIYLVGCSDGNEYKANLSLDDSNLLLNVNADYNFNNPLEEIRVDGKIKNFNPNTLGLTSNYSNDVFDLNFDALLCKDSVSIKEVQVFLDSAKIYSDNNIHIIDSLNLSYQNIKDESVLRIQSEPINAILKGKYKFFNLMDVFSNCLANYLPSAIKRNNPQDAIFDFDIQIKDSEYIRHLLMSDYKIHEPINMYGSVESISNSVDIVINTPKIEYSNDVFENVELICYSESDELNTALTLKKIGKSGYTNLNLYSTLYTDTLSTFIDWNYNGDKPFKGYIDAISSFKQNEHSLFTKIDIKESEININDTTWYISPSKISIYNNNITFDKVIAYNESQFLKLDGIINDNPNDSLLVSLNDIELSYITELVNFNAVRFNGKASGEVILSNIFNNPNLKSNIIVNDFLLQGGRLGRADIRANWDDSINGIIVKGRFIDDYSSNDNGRITNVNGFVSPANNDINLLIETQNTNAEFLNGFLGNIFKDINGNINGYLNVVGPLNDINLVGNVTPDINMQLRANNVKYRIKNDTLKLRPYKFIFDEIKIIDPHGNQGLITTGRVEHKNLKNFSYTFDLNLDGLTCYDEKSFNSDKFLATVYADGNLKINGSDGHPLNITANVRPTQGSVFAYDIATPDAVTSNSFVKFRDRNFETNDSLVTDHEANKPYEYKGDISIIMNIDLTPDCEIKLRMEDKEDGYMSTFGYATLTAYYHNKNPFKLYGNYNISDGKYRLYLQDLIYRDLTIQNGSNVEFNGDPFDATLNLICWHTLNSVPLNDLTASSTTTVQNNKVKVNCVLDITGKLNSMDFNFDLNLPNVNDETRQLVRSMISSEEEMNTQIIYLLGLGRFYTNEFARANGNNTSSQAMSSLISSTLSGQINQMLSNVMGSNSKWSLGTGLTTGEKGWEDLDIEGMLSGRLLNDRLLINGNFGYRDNSLTQTSNFIGDFDVRWRISETGNTYLKAYNQTNDRYFTKATLTTQGIGISYQKTFDRWQNIFGIKKK